MKGKIKIKNDVPHLLSAAMNHPDCPEWLKSKIWNALDGNSNPPAESPEYIAMFLKYSTVSPDKESVQSEVVK